MEQVAQDIFIVNRELNQAEFNQKKILLESKPIILTAIITNRCNLNCIMCSRVKNENQTLPLDLLKQTYKLFPYLQWIDWQGGEVFLVDYFKELFMQAAKYPQIEQHIATNGLLIDEDWAKIFAQSKVSLIYSIDGVTKDSYEFIRRGAKFETLLESLDLVNKYRNKFNSQNRLELSVVVMKCNYKSLFLFVDFCRKYNFQHLNLNFLLPDTAPEQEVIVRADPDALDYLRKVVPEIKQNCQEHGIEVECFFDSYLQEQHTDYPEKKHQAGSIPCSHPWSRLHIDWKGAVTPACQCSVAIGRLGGEDLWDIWNGLGMQRYRRLLSGNCASQICSPQCLGYVYDREQNQALRKDGLK